MKLIFEFGLISLITDFKRSNGSIAALPACWCSLYSLPIFKKAESISYFENWLLINVPISSARFSLNSLLGRTIVFQKSNENYQNFD